MTQPHQPIEIDANGTARFRANTVVRFLLDWASQRGMSLNDLALIPFPDDDRAQFAQLIGYSVYGWGDLHCVSPENYARADAAVAEMEGKK